MKISRFEIDSASAGIPGVMRDASVTSNNEFSIEGGLVYSKQFGRKIKAWIRSKNCVVSGCRFFKK
jgi:hypothetical protein